ncbi:MAG: hypothetical protein M3271_06000 [Actinomycetota bacterium]|nr:hypothetical protein [Actinomycetota bacterium]
MGTSFSGGASDAVPEGDPERLALGLAERLGLADGDEELCPGIGRIVVTLVGNPPPPPPDDEADGDGDPDPPPLHPWG